MKAHTASNHLATPVSSRLSHPPVFFTRWLSRLAAGAILSAAACFAAAPQIAIEQPTGVGLGGSVTAWGANDEGVGQTNVPANLTGVIAISAGAAHTLALKADGTVTGWGDDSYNQLDVPANLTGVKSIAAGNNTSLAVKSDGTLLEWGDDYFGELTVPANLSGVAAASVGFSHVLALKSDTTVTAWGDNSSGQTAVPANLTGVTAISAGNFHSVALKDNGTVVAWGTVTTYDNLGHPTGTQTAAAAAVPAGLSGVTAIAAGGFHTLALKSNGTVVAWGDNSSGQTNVPANLTNVVAIGAGSVSSVAVKSDGTVVVWGDSFNGEGAIPASAAGAVAVTAGNYFIEALSGASVDFGQQTAAIPSEAKTFTIKNTGNAALNITSVAPTGGNASDFTVSTAGMSSSVAAPGQTTFTVTFTPGTTGIRSTKLRIQSSDPSCANYDIALTGKGLSAGPAIVSVEEPAGSPITSRVAIWGTNAQGQMNLPPDLAGVVELSGRWFHFLAVKSDGTVQAWGSNSSGESTVPPGLGGVVHVAAGYAHSAALKGDGTVVAWGRNDFGQASVPPNLTDVVAISAGDSFTLALKADGTVVAWGDNSNGALNVPAGLTDVTAISAGSKHALALKADGSVVAWGSIKYDYGQAVVPADLPKVKAIAAGSAHSSVLLTDGTVRCWGNNWWGQLNLPTGLSDVVTIVAGNDHTVALTRDGSVISWGDEESGGPANRTPAGLSAVLGIGAGHYNTLAIYRGVDFLGVAVGGSTEKVFTIRNTGNQPLTIGSFSVSGANAADFTVDTAAMLTPVPAQSETTFKVTFSPLLGGQRRATLRVASDASNGTSFEFNLTGTGIGSQDARLLALGSSVGYTPNFVPAVTQYTTSVSFDTAGVVVTPSTTQGDATVTVNGTRVNSGSASASIPLHVGPNTISSVVRASDGITTRTYTLTITRGLPANPVLPVVTTSDTTNLDLTVATLNGLVNANGSSRAVTFEYGTSTSYGSSVAATPGTVDSSMFTPVSASLTGLLPHTEYHFRVRASGDYGTATSSDDTFTTANTAPVAMADNLTIAQAVSELNVLGNDIDADGDHATFTVAAIATPLPKTAGTLKLSKGKLTFTASKTFLAGTASPATFAYTMSDGFGGTSTATVTLTYSNASISISPETEQIAASGGTYTIFVTSAGPWKVTGLPAWASANLPVGDSLAPPLQITVAPNSAKTARTASFTIGGVKHTLTQAGAGKVVIGPMDSTDYSAMVGSQFSLAIPMENGPAAFGAKGLPTGVAINKTTGVITGTPTKSGDYAVKVQAANGSGLADATLTFTIHVAPLSTGLVGTFHGLIERSSELNGILGSRLELTTTVTGAYTGKIITGTKSTTLKGLLSVDGANPGTAQLILPIPSLDATLSLTFDDDSDSLTGTLGDDSDNAAKVTGWRNAWAGVQGLAADVAGLHTFSLAQADSDPVIPQGYGYGTLTVDGKTGAVKLTGKLPDGSALTGSTFVGQDGQVLVYVPLYSGKGSFVGVLTLDSSHQITGSPDWYKPASDAKAKDVTYGAGFGPITLDAEGGAYSAPAAGELAFGLSTGTGNAEFDFSGGVLENEGVEFGQKVTIANPKATGLTNTATVDVPVNNSLKMTKFDATTGYFEGVFVLGARKAVFSGELVGSQGYGSFLMSSTPGEGETAATAPKLSGAVTLQSTAQ